MDFWLHTCVIRHTKMIYLELYVVFSAKTAFSEWIKYRAKKRKRCFRVSKWYFNLTEKNREWHQWGDRLGSPNTCAPTKTIRELPMRTPLGRVRNAVGKLQRSSGAPRRSAAAQESIGRSSPASPHPPGTALGAKGDSLGYDLLLEEERMADRLQQLSLLSRRNLVVSSCHGHLQLLPVRTFTVFINTDFTWQSCPDSAPLSFSGEAFPVSPLP